MPRTASRTSRSARVRLHRLPGHPDRIEIEVAADWRDAAGQITPIGIRHQLAGAPSRSIWDVPTGHTSHVYARGAMSVRRHGPARVRSLIPGDIPVPAVMIDGGHATAILEYIAHRSAQQTPARAGPPPGAGWPRRAVETPGSAHQPGMAAASRGRDTVHCRRRIRRPPLGGHDLILGSWHHIQHQHRNRTSGTSPRRSTRPRPTGSPPSESPEISPPSPCCTWARARSSTSHRSRPPSSAPPLASSDR